MMSRLLVLMNRIFITVLVLAILLTPWNASARQSPQQSPDENARQVLAELTPEEKVGQLMLVTFRGTETNEESVIYDLIVNHHIGGVLLKRENDNFTGPENTLPAAHGLISELQNLEWHSSTNQIVDPESGDVFSPSYIPLFVGVSQEGDGYPYSTILKV